MKLSKSIARAVLESDDLALIGALYLASNRLEIIPLRPGSTVPLERAWPSNTSTDESKIRGWRDRYPGCNFGVACGPSGLIVIDLDIKSGKDGISTWEEISGPGGFDTFAVETPSGGRHLYFKGAPIGNSVEKLGSGVDVRSDGGMVVAPWSATKEGMYLPSLRGGLPDLEQISPVPDVVRIYLRPEKAEESFLAVSIPTAPGGAVSTQPPTKLLSELGNAALQMLDAPEGTRNNQLNRSSWAVGKQLPPGHAIEAAVSRTLEQFGNSRGISSTEVHQTVKSGLEAGQEQWEGNLGSGGLFEPVDFGEWFESEHIMPEIFGSGEILYRPALIWVAGEPGSGKSMLCMVWALDVIRKGGKVVWLDDEAGTGDTTGKLLALGATKEMLQGHFRYLDPRSRDLSAFVGEFHSFIETENPDLIVLDSAAGILSNSGVDEDSNSGVSKFMTTVLLPLVKEMGIPTLVMDHLSKSSLNGRYARGAGSKLALVDLSLAVRATKPFSKSTDGRIQIRVQKDRAGFFAQETYWDVDVNVEVASGSVGFGFSEPMDPKTKASSVSDGDMRERILDHVSKNPGVSKSGLEKVPGRKNEFKRDLIQKLISEGVLVDHSSSSGSSLFVAEPK